MFQNDQANFVAFGAHITKPLYTIVEPIQVRLKVGGDDGVFYLGAFRLCEAGCWGEVALLLRKPRYIHLWPAILMFASAGVIADALSLTVHLNGNDRSW